MEWCPSDRVYHSPPSSWTIVSWNCIPASLLSMEVLLLEWIWTLQGAWESWRKFDLRRITFNSGLLLLSVFQYSMSLSLLFVSVSIFYVSSFQVKADFQISAPLYKASSYLFSISLRTPADQAQLVLYMTTRYQARRTSASHRRAVLS